MILPGWRSWTGAVALGVATLVPAGTTVGAAEPSPTAAVGPAPEAEPDEVQDFHLRRGIAEIHRGELRTALYHLERAVAIGGPETDRAAFLAAEVALRLGDRGRVLSAAAEPLGSGAATPYALWILDHALRVRAEAAWDYSGVEKARPAAESPDAETFAAAALLRAGRTAEALARIERSPTGSTPLGLYVRALALEASGQPAESAWDRLATVNPGTPLEAELVALAWMRRASAAGGAGGDPSLLLKRVPTGSRVGPRARLLAGTLELERGQLDSAATEFAQVLSVPRPLPERRQATLALAGLALEREHFSEAYALYRNLDSETAALREDLAALQDSTRWPALWDAWDAAGYWPEALRLGPEDPGASERAFNAAVDLVRGGDPPAPSALRALPGADAPPLALLVPPPDRETWEPVERVALEEEAARAARLDTEHRLGARTEALQRRALHLDHGLDRTARAREEFLPTLDRLLAIQASLDSLREIMEETKNAAIQRFLRRVEGIEAASETEERAAQGMWRFHGRFATTPPGIDSLLVGENALAGGSAELARRWTARIPGLIADSFEHAWSPAITERVVNLVAEAERAVMRGGYLQTDFTVAADSLSRDPRSRALAEAILLRRAREDSLAAVHDRLRAAATRKALARGLAELDSLREPVDYGLSVSAYELSLAGAETGSPSDSLVAAIQERRGEARERVDAFLASYPESPARGEMRYRLADLLLTEAKARFEETMASRVAADEASGNLFVGGVPVIDVDPAAALYRRILAEDADYPHRDAVLFNLGMLEIDRGNPEGETALAALLRDFPSSPFVQEATLRLGDAAFDREEFAASIPLYESAAAGSDRGFTAIALYRLGWAHFREDRFDASADAFRRLLDLYASGDPVPVKTDLRAEAEDHFIQALARGGGAHLFAETFDRIGPRPYERRTLDGLARLYRKYSLYREAVEADRLFLERYPDDPADLTVARRLTESYEAWNRPDEARAARLAFALLFVPGSAWNRSAPSDSLRAEAEGFARNAYTEAAHHHHQRARATGGTEEEWRQAGELYAVILKIWPEHADAGDIHLHAGDVAAHQGHLPEARDHFAAASDRLPKSAPEKIAEADWEFLAVTDRWYGTTLPAGKPNGTGSDSLAAAVREAAERFSTRHPDDPRAADALWRRGTLAFAHRWLEGAATDYENFVRLHRTDPRAPRAAALRGDAWFQAERFDRAQSAYEEALGVAQAAHEDTLAVRLAAAVPLAAHRHAESVAKSSLVEAAPLFDTLAERWPKYEHAGLALYRAGLGYAQGGKVDAAVGAWTRLLDRYPKHEVARDARLQIASTYEANRRWAEAAEAYRQLSEAHPDHPDAPSAWLKGADLWAQAGDSTRAEAARLQYVDRYPKDVSTNMGILEDLAARELRGVGPDRPVSSILGPKSAADPLARYLKLADGHPDLASPALQAQVQFLRGEEMMASYRKLALTLPLDRSIAKKKKSLDEALAAYGDCSKFGAAEWARGATYRIGEALVAFGQALEVSERPADLSGDDRAAYDEVLLNQAWTFYDRGEQVWEGLLRETRGQGNDPGGWLALTQTNLWPRLGQRLFGLPEVEHPVIAATAPTRKEPDRAALPEGTTGVPHPPDPASKTGGDNR